MTVQLMITVRITGLVIPSANNIVHYVFFVFFWADYSKAYIFSKKILPLIKLMRVYIEGIIFEQSESPIRNKQYILDLLKL